MPDINRYAFWQKAIKGDDVPSSKDTMAGFYRHYWDRKDGGQSWHACAIWYDDSGNPVMSAQYKRDLITDADEIYEKFGWLSRYPIPHDIYLSVVERNEPWPTLYQTRMPMKPAGALWTKEIGEKILAKSAAKNAGKAITAAAVQPAAPVDAPENERAVPGSNSGPMGLDQQFFDQVATVKEDYAKWLKTIGGKVSSVEHSEKAGEFARKLAAIRIEAENQRKAEKEPYLVAGREIDAKWKKVTTEADTAEKAALAVTRAFLIEQDRIRKEEERRAYEERMAAERAALQARVEAPIGSEPPPAPPLREPAYEHAPIITTGPKLREVDAIEIEDIDKVCAEFIKQPAGKKAAEEWAMRFGLQFAIAGTKIVKRQEVRR